MVDERFIMVDFKTYIFVEKTFQKYHIVSLVDITAGVRVLPLRGPRTWVNLVPCQPTELPVRIYPPIL